MHLCVRVPVCGSVYAFRIAPSVTFALYKLVYCYHHDYYSYLLVIELSVLLTDLFVACLSI